MLVKIHKSYRDVVAICDSELLGKKFEESGKQIDLTSGFFNGEEMSEEQAFSIIEDQRREDATFNLVGEKAVSLALKAGIIGEEGIIKIQGVPIALTLL
jgi:uncharacterized protein